ncbi:sigma-70 family RNA polymerase sigma factor [Anaerobacillus sp. MEB173]|uniref:sigma-70 family RNA polymerase sigma factor n=1 Tax=Anaerobacillus sp. MEB173 TaxID=3383345 RepID=UPI003F913611
MQITEMTFDEVAKKYQPIILKQLKVLKVYKNYDEFYQIGLIALWEAYERFDPAKGKFSTLAILYVRGKMLTMLQKEGRYQETHCYANEDMEQQLVDHCIPTLLEREIIESYIAPLSVKEKIWVTEAIINDKSTLDIATEYNVPLSTVKSWRKYALKKLRKLNGI